MYRTSRATRLDELLLLGDCLFWLFFESMEAAQRGKNGLGYSLGILSQTYPVTMRTT
jgi:hypothetical protein